MLFYSDIPEVHVWADVFPDRYDHLVVEHARQKYCTFASGEMLSQEIVTNQYTIYIHQLFATSEMLLHVRSLREFQYLRYVLAGSCYYASPNEKKVEVKADRSYLIAERPEGGYTMHIAAGSFLAIDIKIAGTLNDTSFSSLPELLQTINTFRKAGRTGIIDYISNIDFHMRTLLLEILSCNVSNQTRELYMNAKVCELQWRYAKQFIESQESIQRTANHGRLDEVKAYIVGHGVEQTLGTAYLSKKFAMSATTLKREFKRRFRSTIRDFIVKVRMEGARDMLLHSTLSVGAIGTRAGYTEFSSFTRAFTRYFGQSPTQYRKQFVRTMEQARLLP